jgi:hypothetical protein
MVSAHNNVLGEIVGIRDTPPYGRELREGTTWRAAASRVAAMVPG